MTTPSAPIRFAPLRWDKVQAGSYRAFDNKGNSFKIRKLGHDTALNKPIWSIFINDQAQTSANKLSAAKRWVEAIGRKHSTSLRKGL